MARAPRSWWASTSRTDSARIVSSSCTTESGGRPPSFCDRLIEPRVAVEPHAQVLCRGDLGADQVATARRVHVQVVHRRGAPAEGQLRQPDPRRDVRGLLVQSGPQRVQRGEPVEQRAARGREVRPGEVLVQVVVGVHQSRGDQAARRVDGPRRRRLLARGAHGSDGACVDGDPSTRDLGAGRVHRRDEAGVPDEQVHGLVAGRGVGVGSGSGHRCRASRHLTSPVNRLLNLFTGTQQLGPPTARTRVGECPDVRHRGTHQLRRPVLTGPGPADRGHARPVGLQRLRDRRVRDGDAGRARRRGWRRALRRSGRRADRRRRAVRCLRGTTRRPLRHLAAAHRALVLFTLGLLGSAMAPSMAWLVVAGSSWGWAPAPRSRCSS